MAWVAVAVGGASLVSGALGASASSDAARAQGRAANDANQLQREMFEYQRESAKPWKEAGQRALGRMEDPDFQRDFSLADYHQDPGYLFRLQEGTRGLNAGAAARGMGNSGATLKSLLKYNQDYATNDYSNAYNRFNNDRSLRFNRLSTLANGGQSAVQQMGAAGQNYANQAGANMIGAGNARAAGIVGQSNALTGALNTGLNFYQQNQMMQNAAAKPGFGNFSNLSGGGSYTNFGNMS